MDDTRSEEPREKAPMKVLDAIPDEAEESTGYFWEKEASRPEPGVHDKPKTYRVADDNNLRRLVRDLRNRALGSKIPLSEIQPADSSVVKWIEEITADYPAIRHDDIDYLISSFRSNLRTSSKKKGKFVVGVLLLDDVLLIVHSRIDAALFKEKEKDEMITADMVLHPKSVLRAALVDFKGEELTLSAYEYDRTLSKGHARFWGIKAASIRWDYGGSLRFVLWVDPPGYEIIREADIEEVETMMERGELRPDGTGTIGSEEATIRRVEMGRSSFTFPEFYQHFVLVTEEIRRHREFFDTVIDPSSLDAFFPSASGRFEYEEDAENVYHIEIDGPHREVHTKSHPRFVLCFFSETPPGIRPLPGLVDRFYHALFGKQKLNALHVGERVTSEPFSLGSLNLYNIVEIEDDARGVAEKLLYKMWDMTSRKGKAILQAFVCKYLSNEVENPHLSMVFDYIFSDYVAGMLDGEFANDALSESEDFTDFKSKDALHSSPSKAATEIAETVRRYYDRGKWARRCILYGVEDDGTVEPIANMPNDRIKGMESTANGILEKEHLKVELHAISTKGGHLLLVIMLSSD